MRIIFEIANNHQGKISHFNKILNDIEKSTEPYKEKFEFCIKFQFRDIPTFIDSTVDPNSNKHITRFKETTLKKNEWEDIIKSVKEKGFKTIVTPFDEASVQKAIDLKIDEFKIASCSSTEWTLLKKVVDSGKYVTISTGGRNIEEIDDIYSYLAHLIPNKFTIMHCCGIYPAPPQNLNLNSITKFIKRYPLASIGYSGHEDPKDHSISSLAISLGASSIERHIGKVDLKNNIKINAYSLDSDAISSWLKELSKTIIVLGVPKDDKYNNEAEIESLLSLQRGVFINRSIKSGERIKPDDCIFKFPIQNNQVSAAEIGSKYNLYFARKDLKSGSRLIKDLVDLNHPNERILKNYIHKIRGIINEYAEYIPDDINIEVSHHYGIKLIEKYGCCLINIINRNYCKKLIIMTNGQTHPTQHHDVKEETFRILFGEVEINLNGEIKRLYRGEEALIKAGTKHSFKAITNVVIEELSTTSLNSDSYYEDESINKLARSERKTILNLHFDYYKKKNA
tara:strand:- start:2136 stop:3665 length:1530 start_codon:yes stop_codon:yes gene_type:complete